MSREQHTINRLSNPARARGQRLARSYPTAAGDPLGGKPPRTYGSQVAEDVAASLSPRPKDGGWKPHDQGISPLLGRKRAVKAGGAAVQWWKRKGSS